MKARAPDRRARIERERLEQEALFRWRDTMVARIPNLALGFAIPNGAYLQGGPMQRAAQWAKLKKGGARPGISDTFWPVARHGCHGLWIELKAEKPHDAPVTDAQKAFAAAMREQGYKAVVCYGWREAAGVLEEYLE